MSEASVLLESLRYISAFSVTFVFFSVLFKWRKLWSRLFQSMILFSLFLVCVWRWAVVFLEFLHPNIRRFFVDGSISASMVTILSCVLIVAILSDYRATFHD